MNWYLLVLKKYATFNGRARRKEYWMFTLFSTIISVILSLFGALVLDTEGIDTIYSLAVLVPTIAVGVRRMHDVGKSGWFIIIPIYNIILAATDSVNGANEYGENPKGEESLNSDIDSFGVVEKDINTEAQEDKTI